MATSTTRVIFHENGGDPGRRAYDGQIAEVLEMTSGPFRNAETKRLDRRFRIQFQDGTKMEAWASDLILWDICGKRNHRPTGVRQAFRNIQETFEKDIWKTSDGCHDDALLGYLLEKKAIPAGTSLMTNEAEYTVFRSEAMVSLAGTDYRIIWDKIVHIDEQVEDFFDIYTKNGDHVKSNLDYDKLHAWLKTLEV